MISILRSIRSFLLVLSGVAFFAPGTAGAADDIAAIEQELARDPENPAIYDKLGAALLAAGQAERAGKVYRRYVDLRPHDCAAHIGLARSQLAQQLADHAIRTAEAARKLCPDDAAVAFELAKAYAAGRDPISAIESFRRTIELDADRLEAYESLGNLYESRGLLPEAVSAFEAMLLRPGLVEDSPEVRSANAGLARLYVVCRSFDRAAVYAERALALDAFDETGLGVLEEEFSREGVCRVRLTLLLGSAFEKRGDATRARAAYTRVLGCGDDLGEAEARGAIARLDAASSKKP